MMRSKKLSVVSTPDTLTSSEIQLLGAFKVMHHEDRELLIEFALLRSAAFAEKKSQLKMVHGGLQ